MATERRVEAAFAAGGQDAKRRETTDAERNGRADHNSKNAEADDRGERNKDRQCQDRNWGEPARPQRDVGTNDPEPDMPVARGERLACKGAGMARPTARPAPVAEARRQFISPKRRRYAVGAECAIPPKAVARPRTSPPTSIHEEATRATPLRFRRLRSSGGKLQRHRLSAASARGDHRANRVRRVLGHLWRIWVKKTEAADVIQHRHSRSAFPGSRPSRERPASPATHGYPPRRQVGAPRPRLARWA